ncbi:hypothetical protein A2U01_0117504, partial [Trifolium medium]|nr:hypothetical protein [Trifolium medium]
PVESGTHDEAELALLKAELMVKLS